MSKTRDTGYLANVVQYTDQAINFVSGSTTLMSISSSGAVTVTGVISGSNALSSSFSLNSDLLSGTGSVGFTTTGSFTTMSSSLSSRTTQIENIYATTGSNSFRATQSITGSLTVTGQIIAQTLNVQQVTSSIVYSSGSNTFGCDINSRQTFTGSFYQTGSVAIFSNRIGVGTNAPSYQLVVGNDLGDLATGGPTAVIGGTSSNSYSIVGQSCNRNIQMNWIYNSTASCAYGKLNTYSYQNPIYIDGSKIVLQYENTSGTVSVGSTCSYAKFYVQDSNTTNCGCVISRFDTSTGNIRLLIVDENSTSSLPAGISNNTGFGLGIYNCNANATAGVKIYTGNCDLRMHIGGTGITNFSCQVCVPTLISSGYIGAGAVAPAYTIHACCSNNGAYIAVETGASTAAVEATFLQKTPDGISLMALNASAGRGLADAARCDWAFGLRTGGCFRFSAQTAANNTHFLLAPNGVGCFAASVCAGGRVSAINGGVDATFQDAFVGVYSGNNNEQNAIQTSVSSNASNSGFLFMISCGAGLSTRSCGYKMVRNSHTFYADNTPIAYMDGGVLSSTGVGCFKSVANARVMYLRQTTAGTDNIVQFMDHNGTNIWEVVGRNTVFYIYNGIIGNFSMCINPSTNAVHFPGAVSKGSGTFNIEHPLESKKCTHRLVHSFIEGPNADLIYSGHTTLANGFSCINIDCASRMTEGTFLALNRCLRVFTTNETSWDAVKGKMVGNTLVIQSQNENSTDQVSWMVIGERHDEHMISGSITDSNGRIIVEPEVEEQFICVQE